MIKCVNTQCSRYDVNKKDGCNRWNYKNLDMCEDFVPVEPEKKTRQRCEIIECPGWDPDEPTGCRWGYEPDNCEKYHLWEEKRLAAADPEPTSPYHQKLTELADLLVEKQEAYGDSFGKIDQVMAVLYPEGIKPEQYRDALTIVRVIDKLFRIANRKDAFGESPWQDICGYSGLAMVKDDQKKGEHNGNE